MALRDYVSGPVSGGVSRAMQGISVAHKKKIDNARIALEQSKLSLQEAALKAEQAQANADRVAAMERAEMQRQTAHDQIEARDKQFKYNLELETLKAQQRSIHQAQDIAMKKKEIASAEKIAEVKVRGKAQRQARTAIGDVLEETGSDAAGWRLSKDSVVRMIPDEDIREAMLKQSGRWGTPNKWNPTIDQLANKFEYVLQRVRNKMARDSGGIVNEMEVRRLAEQFFQEDFLSNITLDGKINEDRIKEYAATGNF